MPGVKSVAEQGAPDFETTAWNAFYAPRGTPERVVIDLLNSRSRPGALAQPETRQRLLQLGFHPAGGTSGGTCAGFETQERLQMGGPLIKATGLQGG